MRQTSASRREILRARFYRVRWDLDQITARLRQEMMEWAPAPGMRTIAGQLVEIIGTEVQTITRMRDDMWVSDDEVRRRIGKDNDLAALKQTLSSTRNSTLEYLDSLTDAALEKPVDPSNYEWLQLPLVPRAEVLQTIPMHEYYHIGQLTSYLWAWGDDPYQW